MHNMNWAANTMGLNRFVTWCRSEDTVLQLNGRAVSWMQAWGVVNCNLQRPYFISQWCPWKQAVVWWTKQVLQWEGEPGPVKGLAEVRCYWPKKKRCTTVTQYIVILRENTKEVLVVIWYILKFSHLNLICTGINVSTLNKTCDLMFSLANNTPYFTFLHFKVILILQLFTKSYL